jgi:hypothetical protein
MRTGDGVAVGAGEDGASDSAGDRIGSPGLLRKEGDGDLSTVMVGDGGVSDGVAEVIPGSGERAVVAVGSGLSD